MAHLLPLSTGFHPHVPAQDAVTLSMHEFIRLIGPTDARPRVVIDATKLDVPIELLIGEEVRQTTASSNLTLRSLSSMQQPQIDRSAIVLDKPN